MTAQELMDILTEIEDKSKEVLLLTPVDEAVAKRVTEETDYIFIHG